jgi:hypothetical protein
MTKKQLKIIARIWAACIVVHDWGHSESEEIGVNESFAIQQELERVAKRMLSEFHLPKNLYQFSTINEVIDYVKENNL